MNFANNTTRRAILVALPSVATAISCQQAFSAPSPETQTALEKTYLEWLSARNDVEETLVVYAGGEFSQAEEDRVLGPLWSRADRLEDAIISAPCNHPRDLAVKVLAALIDHDEFSNDVALDHLKTDAMRLVNLSEKHANNSASCS